MTLFLLENEACINKVDADKNGVLHYCCLYGYESLLKLLLDKSPDISSKNSSGKTPIMLAKTEKIKKIIEDYTKLTKPKFSRIQIHSIGKKEEKPKKVSKFSKQPEPMKKTDTKTKIVKATLQKPKLQESSSKGKIDLTFKVQKSHKQFGNLQNNLKSTKSKPVIEPLKKTGTQAKINSVKVERTLKRADAPITLDVDAKKLSNRLNS